MGKSDAIILPAYTSFILKNAGRLTFDSVAFLGFPGENAFTLSVRSNVRHFYDIQLGNWNINSEWVLQRKYDLIISTRCPYFAENPSSLLQRCLDHLNPGGLVCLDFGLGDHWRFPDFRVGWVRDGFQEFADYGGRRNLLWSCFWNDAVCQTEQAQSFFDDVKKFPTYRDANSLNDIVTLEVPSILADASRLRAMETIKLWPDAPQLYIITLFG